MDRTRRSLPGQRQFAADGFREVRRPRHPTRGATRTRAVGIRPEAPWIRKDDVRDRLAKKGLRRDGRSHLPGSEPMGGIIGLERTVLGAVFPRRRGGFRRPDLSRVASAIRVGRRRTRCREATDHGRSGGGWDTRSDGAIATASERSNRVQGRSSLGIFRRNDAFGFRFGSLETRLALDLPGADPGSLGGVRQLSRWVRSVGRPQTKPLRLRRSGARAKVRIEGVLALRRAPCGIQHERSVRLDVMVRRHRTAAELLREFPPQGLA